MYAALVHSRYSVYAAPEQKREGGSADGHGNFLDIRHVFDLGCGVWGSKLC